MKRGRRTLLVVVGCALLACAVWVVWPGQKEPEYQGKKLSEWLRSSSPAGSAETKAATDAVRTIGTNAVPWLVRWIVYERPAWQQKKWAAAAVSAIPVAAVRRWAMWGDYRRAQSTVAAFALLGPEAEAAVPELTKLIHDDSRPDSRDRAIAALGYIGEAGFAPLSALLEEKLASGDVLVASVTADSIVRMRVRDTVILAAMPGLLLENGWRSGRVGTNGFGSFPLWRLQSSPAFIPAVTNCLAHSNAVVRKMAITYLARVSREDYAIEAFRRALWDSDGSVRSSAMFELERYAPQVLTNYLNRVPRTVQY